MNIEKPGTQALDVTEFGLGCMGMSDTYGKKDDAESTATIRHACAVAFLVAHGRSGSVLVMADVKLHVLLSIRFFISRVQAREFMCLKDSSLAYTIEGEY